MGQDDKIQLFEEGNETVTNCHGLKMTADRALDAYQRKGSRREWINRRLQAM